MTLAEILSALKATDLDSTVIDAVKALDQTDAVTKLTAELEAEQGKAKGILEDKQKFKTRLEKAELKLKELKDSELSIEERTQKQLEELKEKLEASDAKNVEQANQFKATQRDAGLADITSSIHWSEGTPHDTAKLIVKTAMKDVEDLSDEKAVKSAVEALTESHKAFISAQAPVGVGAKVVKDGKTVEDTDTPPTHKELMAEKWPTT